MASDQLVTAATILRCLAESKRRGSWRLLADLEKVEPDLAEYALEALTTIHHRLLDIGASTRQTRRLDHELRELVVVCIASLRASHLELWKCEFVDSRLAVIDSSLADRTSPRVDGPDSPRLCGSQESGPTPDHGATPTAT